MTPEPWRRYLKRPKLIWRRSCTLILISVSYPTPRLFRQLRSVISSTYYAWWHEMVGILFDNLRIFTEYFMLLRERNIPVSFNDSCLSGVKSLTRLFSANHCTHI